MPEFLVELYVSRTNGAAVARDAERARRAAAELTREGNPVQYLDAIFVPEDETCFHLFRAASLDGVREAAERAELSVDRISEAVRHRRESSVTGPTHAASHAAQSGGIPGSIRTSRVQHDTICGRKGAHHG